ncbi:MAG: bifunctional UDP-N-acetylglucosamine diphosphorylase/glucosamine-1-phosphate N-acetyltransferase GlmU [Clostridia bacterium]
MDNVFAVIMAAGEGTRMKSKIPKVLHSICGQSMVEYVLDAVNEVCTQPPVLVVGHGASAVKEYLQDAVQYAYQEKQLGTGHAVMMARDFLWGKGGYVIVMAGDTPLITGQTIRRLLDFTISNEYTAAALTAVMDNPTGYGRILRDSQGLIQKIVEEKDAGPEEKKVREINASMYCYRISALMDALEKLGNDNAQGEYYLTDVIGILRDQGYKVGALIVEDNREIMGVNNRSQLAEAAKAMRERICYEHMINGVTIIDPDHTYIDKDVTIGRDTVVYPGNVLEGRTRIGEDCILYPNNRIRNGLIHHRVEIQSSVILDSEVGEDSTVGPYAYLRPGSKIGKGVRIGDFVEVKNSTIGDGSKVSHLTYVGDGSIGRNCNIGCGVVFVNYDGQKKHRTVVEDNSFIGCNVNLVAPVLVEENAFVAAGSTVTEKVPRDSLCIARCRQTIKDGWVARRRAKESEDEQEE